MWQAIGVFASLLSIVFGVHFGYILSNDHPAHKVIGMTKEQLIDLLGPPNGDEKGVLTWNLGVAAGADDNYLEFQLRDGKVVSFRVWGV